MAHIIVCPNCGARIDIVKQVPKNCPNCGIPIWEYRSRAATNRMLVGAKMFTKGYEEQENSRDGWAVGKDAPKNLILDLEEYLVGGIAERTEGGFLHYKEM